jgi:protein-S-isoprenylcysteine O-methyltransferase Ste14
MAMDIELVFRLITGVLFMAFIIHRGYYSQKFPALEEATLEKQPADLISRIAALLSLGALFSTLLYVIYPAWLYWASLSLPPWARLAGIGFVMAGFGLLQWSHAALGRNWSDHPRIIEGQRLVVSGPYRWIRHPMYTSFLLILGSIILLSANWLVGELWILTTALDATSRIRYEEAKLLNTFGNQYRAYQKLTGLFLPWL